MGAAPRRSAPSPRRALRGGDLRSHGWSIASGAVPSPNIWDYPEVYEAENRAVDPEGAIETAIGELVAGVGTITDAAAGAQAVPRIGAEGRAADVAGQGGATLGASWGDVLDVGCGTGFHLPRLAARARSVVGVEPHGGLAARAATRVVDLPTVTVRQGSAQSLPLPDASIDLAQARWAYFFGPGCEPGLRELDRVLRRGGLAVVLDHDSSRSSVGRWFAAGLAADGIAHDRAAHERFWTRHGFSLRRVDVRWAFATRADLAAVLRIEFPAAVAAAALREVADRGGGWDVDAAVDLWFRRG